MNCLDMEQLFDAYLDQEMSSSLRLEFDAHRLRCPVCQQKLALLEACEQAIIADRRQPELSLDFTQRVMAGIGAPGPRQGWRHRRTVWLAAGLLQAAAAVLFAVLWFNPPTQPAPVVAEADRLEDILRDGDSVELYRYINERVDTLRAARSNFSDDVGGLTRMALSLGLLDDVSALNGLSPLEQIFHTLIPSPPPAEEPTKPDVYSL